MSSNGNPIHSGNPFAPGSPYFASEPTPVATYTPASVTPSEIDTWSASLAPAPRKAPAPAPMPTPQVPAPRTGPQLPAAHQPQLEVAFAIIGANLLQDEKQKAEAMVHFADALAGKATLSPTAMRHWGLQEADVLALTDVLEASTAPAPAPVRQQPAPAQTAPATWESTMTLKEIKKAISKRQSALIRQWGTKRPVAFYENWLRDDPETQRLMQARDALMAKKAAG